MSQSFGVKNRKESYNYPTNSATIISSVSVNLCQVANRVCLGHVLGRSYDNI